MRNLRRTGALAAAALQQDDGEALDPAQASFRSRARKCVRGSISLAPQLLSDFQASMDPASGDGYLALQDPDLTLLLKKCLRKSDIEEGGQLMDSAIPDARQSASPATSTPRASTPRVPTGFGRS